MAWLTQVFIIAIGGFVGYYMLIVLGNHQRAQMVKVFIILMTAMATLEYVGPALARAEQHYDDVRQDVHGLTDAINSVGNARNRVNGVASNIDNSPITNFGAHTKLPANSIFEIFSGGHLEWPLKSKEITQGFAPPDHHGIDFAVESGTAIMAAMEGNIREVGTDPNGIYGNYVLIDHGGGFQTLYAHCSELKTAQGKHVFEKDVIALSGGIKGSPGAGNSEGPHLHFELRHSGKAIDPMSYLKK